MWWDLLPTIKMALSIYKPGDDGHSIELLARKPVGEKAPRIGGFGSFMRAAKMGKFRPPKAPKSHLQRCAVQVRYTKGGTAGKWFSHGSYIARESQSKDADGAGLGFGESSNAIPVARTVSNWKRDEDDLFFRIIISPEFGDRMDLEAHTREVMARMEQDLGTKLEWVAVVHRNTDNPHVHIALRGVRDDGTELRIPPDYIKEGLRDRAQRAATDQLGFRLERDVLDAQRREVDQMRFTGLDRQLTKRAELFGDNLRIRVDLEGKSDIQLATEHHLKMRLETLKRIGLAELLEDGTYQVSGGFEKSLRTMQKTHDRLKITADHGVLASDRRLPFRVLPYNEMADVEGRILVHGQDDWSGNNFMMLESVKGEVLQVSHTKEMSEARHRGALRPGSYLRIAKSFGPDRKPTLTLEETPDADSLDKNDAWMKENGARIAEQIPDGWSGWLGEMRRAALAQSNRPTKRKRS